MLGCVSKLFWKRQRHFDVRGGGGGGQAHDVFRCTEFLKNGFRIPTTLDINDIMEGGGGGGGIIIKRHSDVIFSKIV